MPFVGAWGSLWGGQSRGVGEMKFYMIVCMRAEEYVVLWMAVLCWESTGGFLLRFMMEFTTIMCEGNCNEYPHFGSLVLPWV